MPVAANIASKFWKVPMGASSFQSATAFGVLNATGTHALGKSGVPSSWGTKRTATIISKHANEMAGDGVHEWVAVFDRRASVKR